MACATALHSSRMGGEGNGRYLHGEAAKSYPRGWNRNHKHAIRARDAFRCRLCLAPEGYPAHHVHHIDYVKENLDPSNLITVCKTCHGQMHGRPSQRELWRIRLSVRLANADQ